MKFLKAASPLILAFFLIGSGPHFASCSKKVVHDTIVIKDTLRITDSICYDLKDSLVALYKFTGGSLKDSSGNNNDITFNNATPTTDRFGKANNAFLFNGTSNYMYVKNSSSLNPTKAISLMAVIKFNDFYRGECHANTLFMKGKDNTNGVFGVRINPLGQACQSFPTDTSKETVAAFYGNTLPGQVQEMNVSDPSTFMKINKWVNIIFTYDGFQGKLYIDGQLKNTIIGTAKFTSNTNDMFIGGMNNGLPFAYWFNGVMDEIRVYNKALCDGEVKQLNKLKN